MNQDSPEIREIFLRDLEVMNLKYVGAIILDDAELNWLRKYTERKVFANDQSGNNCLNAIPETRRGSLPDCFIPGTSKPPQDSLGRHREIYPIVFYEEEIKNKK